MVHRPVAENSIEYFHVYINVEINFVKLLKHLNQIDKDKIHGTFVLFVDDTKIPFTEATEEWCNQYQKLLDISTEKLTNIEVEFESNMSIYTDHLIEILKPHLKVKSFNRGKDKKYFYKSIQSAIMRIHPTTKLTCLGYSLIWSLKRIGVFENQLRNTITYLDSQFCGIENQVLDICHDLGYHDKILVRYL